MNIMDILEKNKVQKNSKLDLISVDLNRLEVHDVKYMASSFQTILLPQVLHAILIDNNFKE
jgi:hypothetical protein